MTGGYYILPSRDLILKARSSVPLAENCQYPKDLFLISLRWQHFPDGRFAVPLNLLTTESGIFHITVSDPLSLIFRFYNWGLKKKN